MKYELANGNRIEADAEFIAARYPDAKLLPDTEQDPAPEVEPPPAELAFVPRVISRLDFYGLFTDAELVTVYAAAKQSIPLEIFLDKVKVAQDVTINDPRTIAGVQALEVMGILGEGRAAEILA
jgi:hypothetical protein